MKQKLFLAGISMVFFSWFASAQQSDQVTEVQYYFDNDPGIGVSGNGAILIITPTASLSQLFSFPLHAELDKGFHNLYVRVKDEHGRWSLTERRLFILRTIANTENIKAFQYYFDTDPGTGIPGNGAVVPVTSTDHYSETIAITVPNTLENGFHCLYIRAQDESDQWSLIERRSFIIQNIVGTEKITAYQYYFDADPGVGVAGNGEVVPVTATAHYSTTVAITVPGNLENGFHSLYLRTRDESGQWSLIERRSFIIQNVVGTENINAYQYYFDTDPGVGIAGNGAVVPVTNTDDYSTTAIIPLSNTLPNGFHNLYIRTRDESGQWSLVERRSFIIQNVTGTENITAYQYYFDQEPGVGVEGNGLVIPVIGTDHYSTTVAIPLPVTLESGFHNLYLRTRDESGQWSLIERRSFIIQHVTSTQNIIGLEYYFDTDPGVGNGNPFPIQSTANFTAIIDLGVPCLSIGTHYLYVRAKNTSGFWSIIERDTVSITSGVSATVVTPAGPVSICESDSVTLSANLVTGMLYQWLLNGSDIPDQISNSYVAKSAGNYSLRTTCSGSSVLSNTVVVNIVAIVTFYEDSDVDGYGNPANDSLSCSTPGGYVTNNTDCNDGNSSIHPGAAETCNGIDDDCDNLVDDADPNISGRPSWYADSDGDGFGNAAAPTLECIKPSGYVSDNSDCNDALGSVHPGAVEACNGIDDDCDGAVDEDCNLNTYYADVDGDYFGDPDNFISVIDASPPAGYVTDNTDCNDGNNSVYPGAAETCNGIDDDCDGLTDDADPGITGQSTWYADADDDGFGNPLVTTLSCFQPDAYVPNNTDCDDTNPLIHPASNPGIITGNSPLCIGDIEAFSSNGEAGGSWSSSNTNVATVDISGTITALSAGTTTIFYTVSGCNTSANSFKVLTVDPNVSAGTVIGSTPLCLNEQGIYSSNGTSGGTWSSSDPSVASVNVTSGLVTGVSAGSADIIYMVNSGCGSPVAEFKALTVTGTPIGNSGTISGTTPLCVGIHSFYTSNGDAGGTWSSSSTSVATVNSSTGEVTAVGAGSTLIRYSVSGCKGSVVSQKVLTVNAVASAGVLSGTNPLCTGASNQYLTNGTAGGSWSSSDNSVATIDAATGIIYGVGPGTATIEYAVTGCGGAFTSFKLVTVIDPVSAGIINGNSSLCPGDITTFTSSGTTDGHWTSDNPAVASVNSISGEVTASNPGTAIISYSVSGCNGNLSASRIVTVIPNATAGSVSGVTPLCVGAQTTFNSNGTAGGTWSSSDPAVAIVDVYTGIVTALSEGSTTIEYTITACGGTFSASNVLTVDGHPPVFSFSGNPDFISSVVSPTEGEPTFSYRFEINYTHADGELPSPGYPRISLDFEGNGVFTDPKDFNLIMSPVNASDVDVTNGKTYFIFLSSLYLGSNWTVNFIARATGGCEAQSSPYPGPDITTNTELSIFANDITFSDVHPGVSSPDTVYAVIHNDSAMDASAFWVHLINQYDPGATYPDILVPGLPAYSSIQVSWPIITPSLPAWVPMQVVIDYANDIEETNELDNQAIRPFTNGPFVVPGNIKVTAGGSSTICQNYFYSVCGNAKYENTAVVLQNPSVAGATITVELVETGQQFSGYTNSNGDYCISFLAPEDLGTYSLEVSITDFTLTGDTNSSFAVIYCPPPPPVVGPDLISSITLDASEVFAGSPITGTVKIMNIGNQSSAASIADIHLASNGALQQLATPALLPGEFHIAQFSLISPLGNGKETLISMADATASVTETEELNNSDEKKIRICPLQPDLRPGGYRDNEIPVVFLCENIITFSIGNSSCITVTDPFDVLMQVFQNSILVNSETRTITSNVPRDDGLSVDFNNVFPTTGNYQVKFLVDINNSIPEFDESNNEYSVQFVVKECKAELSLEVACSPVSTIDPAIPGNIIVHTTLINSGHADAIAPFTVDFETGGNHYPITILSSMPRNTTVPVAATFPTPPFGCPVLTIEADATNLVEEYSEDNSLQMMLNWDDTLDRMCYEPGFEEDFPNPNFWEVAHNVGTPVTMAVGLWSYSTYTASLVNIRFEVSGPGITGWLDLGYAPATNVGQSCGDCPLHVTLPFPFVFSSPGIFQVRMTADGDNRYIECNENNNVKIVDVTITSSPDYRTLSKFIAPSLLNPEVGEPITVDVTYENLGATKISDSLNIHLRIDNNAHQTVRAKGIASGTKFTVHFSNPWASLTAGLHVIRAITDYNNEIQEANESNNEATRSFVVGKAANLYFQVFAPDNSFPALGQAITVNARIGNSGALASEGDVEFSYLNDLLDTIPIGTIHINVSDGDSVTISLPWTVLDNTTTLIARIVNLSILQLDYDNKVATTLLGNFDISLASTPACFGENNGTLTAIVNGGKPPFLITWNTGATGAVLTGYMGTYTVTVRDGAGSVRVMQGKINGIPVPALYEDADGDGYGNPFSIIEECYPQAGYVSDHTDCHDGNNAIHPGATEICNGIDDNCNGQIDEGVMLTFYIDEDEDGFGNPDVYLERCTLPAGYVTNHTDCNDAIPTAHPGAAEVCNGIDDNCNGQVDEGVSTTYYRDLDGDGFGNPNATTRDCTTPTGFVAYNTDCNDDPAAGGAAIYHGAIEVCNGIDDDCDGLVDDADPNVTGQFRWYADVDGDSYGNAAVSILACTKPQGHVSDNTDCNDNNSLIHPGVAEICNNQDDNCNGQIDEGVLQTFYLDADGDGFGDPGKTIQACSPSAGYVDDNGDCNDGNSGVNPGAIEVCNGIDDNCNGTTDEGCTGCLLTVNAGSDEYTYYGFPSDQTATHTIKPTGGTPPYTFTWTLDRALQCNNMSSSGDEVFAVAGGACGTTTTCPLSGNTGPTPLCTFTGDSSTVTAALIDPGNVCITVRDAAGCEATDCFTINAYDSRCFAGNSGIHKVLICHFTGNVKKPWVEICVDDDAVAALIAQGDYVGRCRTGKREMEGEAADNLLVYPNPAHDKLFIQFTSNKDDECILRLMDMTGRTVEDKIWNVQEGTNLLEFNLKNIASGIYMVTVINGEGSRQVRVVVE